MSVHLILDFYDVQKLQHPPNETLILLYTGIGTVLNATDTGIGTVLIGSTAKDFSVLQISTVIIPLGIDNSTSNSPPSQSPLPVPVPAAFSPPQSPTPAPAPPQLMPPSMSPAKSPTSSSTISPLIPTPAKSPTASPAMPHPTPAADAPPVDSPHGACTNLQFSHGDSLTIISFALWLVTSIL